MVKIHLSNQDLPTRICDFQTTSDSYHVSHAIFLITRTKKKNKNKKKKNVVGIH